MRGRRVRRESVRGEAAAFQAARDGRDLVVHGRRLEPGGYVRSEAGAGEVRRRADRRESAGRRHRAAGISRAADAEPVHIREVRAERHRSLRAVSAPQPSTSTRSRSCARCTGDRTITCRAPTKCRRARSTWDFPSVGSWVTYGLGSVASSLPALRRHDRRARRAARRPERLERRIHSGRVSGNAVPIDAAIRSSI